MREHDIPIIEVFLSGVSIWWAFVLFMSSGALDSTLPRYMESLGTVHEFGWGFIFLTAAIVKVYGIATKKPKWRSFGLIASFCLYSLICTGFILANNIISTGTGIYFLLTVLAWWGLREVKYHGNSSK